MVTEDMVHTNLIEKPQKKTKGIIINKVGSNHPKKKKDDLQPGDKGKWKKHIVRKGTNVEPAFSEPKDAQPVINRRDELRARNHPITTTPLTTKSVPTPAPPPAAPELHVVAPPSRLLNRLKGGGLRTILEEK
ncbi:hypothetical protein H5410_061930 [Solanum commersonii]|uniref:Uncharacterized protein n=1 Tax=Solanum commersonii TaxID=4109 RepID=A0A9J5WA75_SOLCO|nr:hypothetical protein H5410_061930 [Solanum commersonii]